VHDKRDGTLDKRVGNAKARRIPQVDIDDRDVRLVCPKPAFDVSARGEYLDGFIPSISNRRKSERVSNIAKGC
jgi:hypothetical protein